MDLETLQAAYRETLNKMIAMQKVINNLMAENEDLRAAKLPREQFEANREYWIRRYAGEIYAGGLASDDDCWASEYQHKHYCDSSTTSAVMLWDACQRALGQPTEWSNADCDDGEA